jgi:hypothetical protein
MCAPKGVGPSAVVDFSCKAALSEGVAMGAARPIMDPQQLGPRRLENAEWWAKAMPPLCGSTRACEKATRADVGPQRARILAPWAIYPANQHLLRVPKWVPLVPIMDSQQLPAADV